MHLNFVYIEAEDDTQAKAFRLGLNILGTV